MSTGKETPAKPPIAASEHGRLKTKGMTDKYRAGKRRRNPADAQHHGIDVDVTDAQRTDLENVPSIEQQIKALKREIAQQTDMNGVPSVVHEIEALKTSLGPDHLGPVRTDFKTRQDVIRLPEVEGLDALLDVFPDPSVLIKSNLLKFLRSGGVLPQVRYLLCNVHPNRTLHMSTTNACALA